MVSLVVKDSLEVRAKQWAIIWRNLGVYTIRLSVLYGAVVGYLPQGLLHRAEVKKYVDHESFLVFAIALAVSSCTPSL